MNNSKEDKIYWMPDSIPEYSLKWNISQEIKTYILSDGSVRKFPKWYYDNGAYVDDDYLFYNEGWKILLDDEPQLGINRQVQIELKPKDQWNYTEEKSVKKTYWEREIVDNIPYHNPKTHKLKPTPDSFWEKTDTSVVKTYTIIEKNQMEIDFDEKKMWWELRDTRNKKLLETDYIFIISMEKNLKINPDLIKYRQELRDLPLTISDIYIYDFPKPPTNYFI